VRPTLFRILDRHRAAGPRGADGKGHVAPHVPEEVRGGERKTREDFEEVEAPEIEGHCSECLESGFERGWPEIGATRLRSPDSVSLRSWIPAGGSGPAVGAMSVSGLDRGWPERGASRLRTRASTLVVCVIIERPRAG